MSNIRGKESALVVEALGNTSIEYIDENFALGANQLITEKMNGSHWVLVIKTLSKISRGIWESFISMINSLMKDDRNGTHRLSIIRVLGEIPSGNFESFTEVINSLTKLEFGDVIADTVVFFEKIYADFEPLAQDLS